MNEFIFSEKPGITPKYMDKLLKEYNAEYQDYYTNNCSDDNKSKQHIQMIIVSNKNQFLKNNKKGFL